MLSLPISTTRYVCEMVTPYTSSPNTQNQQQFLCIHRTLAWGSSSQPPLIEQKWRQWGADEQSAGESTFLVSTLAYFLLCSCSQLLPIPTISYTEGA